MNKRLCAALVLVGLGLAGGAVSAWAEDLVFPIQITRIAVEGNAHVALSDIEKVMPLKVGDALNAYSDLQPTSQAILDSGWFSEVYPTLTQDGVVTFHVTENPVVQKIEITGNTHERAVEVFGLKLFSFPIMSTWQIRQVLRDHNIKVGKIVRTSDLKDALSGVVDEYKKRGYALAMIGDVRLTSTLSIEVIEGHVSSNVITGLNTVPMDVATKVIDLPTDEVLRTEDLTRVRGRLDQSVYFTAETVVPTQGPTRDSIVLNWTLTERTLLTAPAAIRSIVLEGVTKFPSDVVTRQIGALPEGTVDNYAVLRALEGVYDLYTHAGFLMVRFSDPRIEGDVLRVRVDEGMVSEISYGEGTATRQRVLEKTLQIAVGRVLTRNDLVVSYQRLGALGYFDVYNVIPQWTDGGVKVTVSVTDKKTLAGLNGSLAFEPATGGIIGQLTVKQRNILGTGQDVSVSYDRGVSPEGKPETSTWEFGYSTLATRTEFDLISIDLYRKTQDVTAGGEDEPSQTNLTLGGSVSFDYPVAGYTDFVIGYRHDLTRELSQTEWASVDAISFSLKEDSTDDMIFPTRGTRQSISLEKAGGFAVGKEFTKLNLLWADFVPFYDDLFPGMDHALAIRVKVGLGDDGAVGTEAYEFGGPTTIRGIDGTQVKRMAIANVEHRLELTDGFVLTAFLDTGMNLETIRWDALKATTGLELGISAAGVYIRLDVVWSLGADASWTPRFDIGFGPMF